MNEILMFKYGEIALKGLNKKTFEKILIKNLQDALAPYGRFRFEQAQSTIYAQPVENTVDIDGIDMDGAVEAAQKIFGIAAVCRAAVVEKDMEKISAAVLEYIPQFLEGKKSFKVEAKRSDKKFPLTSPQICEQIGGDIYENYGRMGEVIAVDVNNPEVTVHVEIRDFGAYIHAGRYKGAGGMPVGSGGNGLLLLSGGIDSPVAGYLMAKRGVKVHAVHFESPPYTSERAKEKVLSLAQIISAYCGNVRVCAVSITKIQERLQERCDIDYFTLLLRRSMMRIASKIAKRHGCGALITGESLGQVASQTMQALGVTDDAASLLVLRPCIAMDKEEIVTIARKIGTYETSIQPYEDCCTVFTPRHPVTKPELRRILEEEAKADLKELEDEIEFTE